MACVRCIHFVASCCYPHLKMNLLRRAASETLRELGLNVPTAVSVLLAIAFTTILFGTFSNPDSDFVTGFVLWMIQSFAWLLAIVVVFVLLFAWNTFKVARRDQSARAHLILAAEIAASEDGQMKSFLRNNLLDPHYGVTKCYVFGSVVGQYPTRDVDIVIQFDSSKPGQVRVYRDRLRSIERLFEEHHGSDAPRADISFHSE